MKVFVTALAAEARPLIRHFKLRRHDHPGGIPSYRSDDTWLVISGTSKVKTAIATTWILSQTPGMEGSVALNFGFCGCRDRTEPVGTLFLINRICDVATGRSYYPDILFRRDLMERSISTHDRPVREDGPDGNRTHHWWTWRQVAFSRQRRGFSHRKGSSAPSSSRTTSKGAGCRFENSNR